MHKCARARTHTHTHTHTERRLWAYIYSARIYFFKEPADYELDQKNTERIADELAKAESAQGVSGYSVATATLEAVSLAKADADQAKGSTLEEISSVVQAINQAVQEQKTALAPLIKDLKYERSLAR